MNGTKVASFLKRPGAKADEDERLMAMLNDLKIAYDARQSRDGVDGETKTETAKDTPEEAPKDKTLVKVGGKRSTLRLTQIVRCPASRRVPTNLLQLAVSKDNVIPKPCEWDSIEIDDRSGELCLPPDYVARINRYYKDTAAGASARLMKDVASLANGESNTLSDGVLARMGASLGNLGSDAFTSLQKQFSSDQFK